jgi:hypothetical protein
MGGVRWLGSRLMWRAGRVLGAAVIGRFAGARGAV